MTTTDISPRLEELDYRENDGIQVSLLWSRDDDSLAVLVVDTKAMESFELRVRADEALDVFHHPFAYAASRLAGTVSSDLALLLP